jgi:hypothetical protein
MRRAGVEGRDLVAGVDERLGSRGADRFRDRFC